ncbi:C-type lectin domain family 2 member H-like [Cricetulus griseus]|uniref:C-type lectin domain family 2 member H-like n=1 Tax=Cricetulus griseus TaxID=10029 RepID=A0A9J7GHA8_CRIGR|nr:C-type lectin domain family 2 member H-like [Cricetulus griseus]XP_027285766.1 C-type lectin domain family 2 member H-like [Cricetulus griseus]
MGAVKIEEASMSMIKTDLITPEKQKEVKIGKKYNGKCLRIISIESSTKLYCCYVYAVIMALIVAVVSLKFTLSLKKRRPVIKSPRTCYTTCPRDWIGFGSKCFYFSEDMRNWTFSQTSCMELEAHLAIFNSLKELNFLKRYKGPSDHWIGLHRKSSAHPWMWADNTEYNNLVPTRGEGQCGYLSDMGISSARDYTHRKWICSKSNRCI